MEDCVYFMHSEGKYNKRSRISLCSVSALSDSTIDTHQTDYNNVDYIPGDQRNEVNLILDLIVV